MASRTRFPLDPDADSDSDSDSDSFDDTREQNESEDYLHNTDLEQQSDISTSDRVPRDPSVIQVSEEDNLLLLDYKDQVASRAPSNEPRTVIVSRSSTKSQSTKSQEQQDPMATGPNFKDQLRGASASSGTATTTTTTTATTTGAVFVRHPTRAAQLRYGEDSSSSLEPSVQPRHGAADETFLVSAVLVDETEAPPSNTIPEAKVTNPMSNRWRFGWCLVGSVLVGGAVAGGLCGSGVCSSRTTNKTESSPSLRNAPSPSPIALSVPFTPTRTPTTTPTLAFETPAELYRAIDEYMAVTGSASADTSPVAVKFGYPIGRWNVSKIANFSRAFDPDRTVELYKYSSTKSSSFNEDLLGWDMSSATTLHGMFAHAGSFNGNIATWNTSSVTDMSYMFHRASNFSGDLSLWDVSRVTSMASMFFFAEQFDSSLSAWDTGNLISTQEMFANTKLFKGDLSDWDVSRVKAMRAMFWYAEGFSSDLSQWNVGNVEDMSWMFLYASVFESDLSKWQVSKLVNMESMFDHTEKFSTDFSSWDVSRVTNAAFMFQYARFPIVGIENWNVSNLQSMKGMFQDAYRFDTAISSWDVSKATDLDLMFYSALLFNQNLCAWRSRLSIAASVENMFTLTRCSAKADPNLLDPDGPMCELCV